MTCGHQDLTLGLPSQFGNGITREERGSARTIHKPAPFIRVFACHARGRKQTMGETLAQAITSAGMCRCRPRTYFQVRRTRVKAASPPQWHLSTEATVGAPGATARSVSSVRCVGVAIRPSSACG